MKKNNTLNALKTLAAICVIFIHIKFPGKLGALVTVFSRFAVPFFFMISGYYAYQSSPNKEKALRNIKKTAKLLIMAFILYFIWKCIYNYHYETLDIFFKKLTSKDEIINFIKYNKTSLGTHLWYLPSILYVYFIYYFVDKYKLHKMFYFLIPILLILNILMGEVAINYKLSSLNFITRNFLFTGLPFFMIGNYINCNKDKIKLNNIYIIITFIIASLFALLSYLYLKPYDFYINTIFLSLSIFLFAIKNPNIVNEKNIFSIIGEKYSMYIYISHIIILDAIKIMFYPIESRLMRYLLPIIIVFISLIVSIIYSKFKDKLKSPK